MAKLSFRIQADYQEVQRLREEIAKLKQEIKGTDAIQSPHAFNVLNTKLQQTSRELGDVTGRIAQASATVETDFKKKIFDASQGVNDFTEKIIAQKAVVKLQTDILKKLKEEYTGVGKNTYQSIAVRERLSSVNKILEEERHKLFLLTQEQATARLSVKKLRDEYALFKQEGGGTAQTMDLLTSKMKGIAATIVGGMGLKELASRIISVRAEFESMETSLKVLLGGNQERLNNIMGQIKDYALASPLNTKDMVGAVQMMTSFGIEAEKSIDYLKAIGDISMGDTGKFNSLALAFSQMSSAGKLMGQDLLQMVNAGFNPLEEIARKTGKSIGQLKDEMSKGAISSKMVQDAFISATSAGGKFFGMSQEGAKTLNGQISMLQESFDMMFNEIGQKGEGVVMGAVQTATKLVENYEQVGRVLLGLITAYGTYRTALAIATFAQNGHTFAMTLARTRILLTQKAQALLNATMLANPYVLAATALGALVGVMIMQKTQTDLVNDATKRYNEEKEKVINLEREHNEEIQKLCSIAGDESLSTDNRRLALVKLEQKYPSIFKKYDTEAAKLAHILEIKQQIAALEGKASITNPQNELLHINKRLAELDKLGKTARAQSAGYTFGAGGGSVMQIATLTPKEKAEQAALLKRKAELAKQISKDSSDNYLKNLTGVSNSELLKQINQRKNLLAQMSLTGKKYGKITIGGANGTFSRDELEGQVGILESEQNKRKKAKNVTKRDLQEQKKKLQAQLDGLSEIEAKGKKGAELRKKINAISEREKVYSVANDTKAATKAEKEHKQRIKDAKAQQKANEDLARQKIVQSEAELELENQVEQSRIDSLVDGSEKTAAAMKLAHKKEMEQIEKQKQDYLKKKQEEAKAEFEADPKNKDKVFNMSSVTLSAAEQGKFDEMRANAKIKHDRENKEAETARLQSLYDYLKEYGTVQEQMYAISKEYDEKIAKEQDENRKKSLEKEKASALAKSNAGNLALDIDWGATFGGIGSVLKDIAKSTLKEVEAYMKTAEFKALSPADKKAYSELRNNLRKEGAGDAVSPFNFNIWGKIADETKVYQDAVKTLKEKTKAHTKAVEDLKTAEKELSKATDETSKSIAKAKVEKAKKNVEETGKEQQNSKDEKDKNYNNLKNSTDKAVTGLDNFSSALQQMSNGTLKGFTDGVSNLISSIGGKGKTDGLVGAIGSKAGGLIGAILQIIDALGDDPSGFIKGLLDKIAKVVETVLQELPHIVLDVVKGIGNVVGGIISGIGSWFVGGGNEKAMEKEIANLAKANEALSKSIDELSKNIGKKDNTTEESLESYKKAKAAEEEWEANQRKAIANRASEWTSSGYGFLGLGGKSSFDAHSRGRDWWGWNDFNKKLSEIGSKAKVFSSGDMWKLTPEEMKALRESADTAWREFFNNSGHKNPQDLVDEYIERAGKRDELTSVLNEKLTGYSWDGFMDSYKSALKNLESTTEDFANNVNEMISNALLESFSNETLKPKIKELYDYIAKAAENGLDNGEIAYIRKKNEEIAALGLKKRSELEQAGLISKKDSGQNASANGVSSITYEQASNIVALTTAGNISRDQIKDLLTGKLSSIDVSIVGLQSLAREHNSIADELRTIQANSYIELQGIHEDTTAMSKAMKTMSGDVADIKKKIKDM